MTAVKPETQHITGQYLWRQGLLLYFRGYLELWKQAEELSKYKQKSFFLV